MNKGKDQPSCNKYCTRSSKKGQISQTPVGSEKNVNNIDTLSSKGKECTKRSMGEQSKKNSDSAKESSGILDALNKVTVQLTNLNTKVDNVQSELKTIKSDLENKIDACTRKVDENKTKIVELEKSINYAHRDIVDFKQKIEKLEKKDNDLTKRIDETQLRCNTKKKETDKEIEELKQKLNAQERYTREYCIRLKGIKHLPASNDYRRAAADILVRQKLVETPVEEVVRSMEVAHPLGPQRQGANQLIVRFYSRSVRNTVVQKAKAVNKDAEVRVVEDLTKMDYDLRKRTYPQMQEAYRQGQKCRFHRGKLYIEGNEVAIRKK